MQQLRTIRRFVRVLVALFLFAQLAGVVPFESAAADASATPVAAAMHDQLHHAGHHEHTGAPHDHGHPSGHAGDCCALHAFFGGVLPSTAAVEHATLTGERIGPDLAQGCVRSAVNRLDRPPKPLA